MIPKSVKLYIYEIYVRSHRITASQARQKSKSTALQLTFQNLRANPISFSWFQSFI